MKTTRWMVFAAALAMLACSSSGGASDPATRCMNLCGRLNTSCMRGNDCSMVCTQLLSGGAACSGQVNTYLSCGEGASDLCTTTSCDAAQAAVVTCVSGGGGDAGT